MTKNYFVSKFEEDWHAYLFAITVHLSDLGYFSWTCWKALLVDTLQTHGVKSSVNSGDDYFLAWLEALELLLCKSGLAEIRDLSAIKIELCQAHFSRSLDSDISRK